MQTYGPQNLFEHGREIEIPQKITGGKKQRRKGKRSDAPQATCEHCAKRFTPERKTSGRYCSKQCVSKSRIKDPEWLQCSACLAKIGIGMAKCAQMFKTSKSRVLIHWRRHGIKARPPKIGSWLLYAQSVESGQSSFCGWWGRRDEALLWMSDHQIPNVDWSSIWNREKAKIRANDRYNEWEAVYHRTWMRHVRSHNALGIYPDWRSVSQRFVFRSKPKNKVVSNLRRRLRELIRSSSKGGSGKQSNFIGCSTQQLAKHLEANFKQGMTWENYGTHWHVDHTIPCAAFDQSDEKQRRQCWHWSNLKPMGAAENMKKSAKITNPQMNLLLCASH